VSAIVPYSADTDFPIQNLPFGIFSSADRPRPRVGVAIGDQILDLAFLSEHALFHDLRFDRCDLFHQPTLNPFMALGRSAWQAVRARLQQLLRPGSPLAGDRAPFVPQAAATLHLPVAIGDYTDFYSSRAHATHVGSMFRDPQNALLPNWLHLPVAYHGRAGSIVVSGTPVRRPHGQQRPAAPGEAPRFGPTQQLDFELELGWLIGTGNGLGERISADHAAEHLFGCVLVNDWSARDIQAWEYQPLGPFLSKNFATSISPWVVTLEALAPFRVPGPVQDPPPLPYLHHRDAWHFNIELEVSLHNDSLPAPHTVTRTNARTLYWSIAQHLAHHTVTGCNLRTGDLLASGTISDTTPGSQGCLLELTWRGTRPLSLPDGTERAFLADGDHVTMRGHAPGDGFRIGFGTLSNGVTGN
jgi:fumarylacetoacetase